MMLLSSIQLLLSLIVGSGICTVFSECFHGLNRRIICHWSFHNIAISNSEIDEHTGLQGPSPSLILSHP